jgi:hypothetical protein
MLSSGDRYRGGFRREDGGKWTRSVFGTLLLEGRGTARSTAWKVGKQHAILKLEGSHFCEAH